MAHQRAVNENKGLLSVNQYEVEDFVSIDQFEDL